uniref:Transposable element P transposase n=1 Tax=Sipha flava TaxID=143950 RepID=A0A2S2Q3S0_9HEMI
MNEILLLNYYKSPSAYKFLRNIQINLPGVSTIRRLISSNKFKPGLNSNILKQLTLKVGSMSDEEKYCTLVFDEMKIKKFLEYSKYLDVVEGYEDLGTKRCSNALATQAMVFLIRGMYSSWKMPVSYFLSATSMKATILSKLIVDHVQQLMNCGLKVRAIVCDQGPNNRSAFNKLNLTKEKPWFIVNNIKIFAIYDVYHIFLKM